MEILRTKALYTETLRIKAPLIKALYEATYTKPLYIKSLI